jgi:PKD repeat protein
MPTQRGAGGFSGYFVDWIDRASDRGLRLSRVDSGVFVEIVRGQGAAAPPDVPLHWRLDLDGDRIRLSGDDVLYFDVCDNTYQCGFVGFWTWIAGQQMVVDDFNLDGDALAACFNAAPRSGVSGTPIRFDASCSSVFSGGAGIASYSWDFGDGETTSGLVVDHAFEFADVYTVSLTVEDSLGNRASTSCTVSVAEALVPFADCFDRDPGPIDGEWTVASGNWNITPGGRLEVVTGGEAFIYAGSPPRLLGPEFVAEVDVEFVSGAHPVVGRHGAVHFYWNVPTTDRFAGDSSGYVVFYIDRTGDRGLTLARFDGAALAVLNPPGGTPAFPNPPAQLRIEVDGPTIRVFADGALAIEANDATYRSGLFGLWSWNDNTIRFDNVRVAATSAPVTPPCSLSLTCTVIPPAPGDIGLLQLDGVTSVTDACIAPDGCECIEVETSVDGSPFSRAPSLGLIPLRPDTCPTGTMHEVRARCVNALGQVGPEASCTFTCPEFPPAGGGQVPGDCNQDGDRDISDAVCLFGFLFTGTVPRLPCADGTAAHPANLTLLNHNGDAAIDISDGIALLNFLFSTGAPPASGLGCLRIRDCPERCEP